MAHRILAPYRRAFYALVCSLEFILTACSGGAGDVTAPDPGRSRRTHRVARRRPTRSCRLDMLPWLRRWGGIRTARARM